MNATPEVETVFAVWSVQSDSHPALVGLWREEKHANAAASNEFDCLNLGDPVVARLDSTALVDTGYFNAETGLADDVDDPTVLVFVESTVLL